MSIRWKLILSIGLPLLCIYAGLFAWESRQQRQIVREQTHERVAERASVTSGQVNERLQSIMQGVDSLASSMSGRGVIPELQLRQILASGMRPTGWVHGVWVAYEPQVQRHGLMEVPLIKRGGGPMELTDLARGLRKPYRDEPWYRQAMEQNKAVWIDRYDDPALSPDPVAIYAQPLREGDHVIGVICAAVRHESLERLNEDPRQRMRRPGERPTSMPADTFQATSLTKGGYVILDRNGEVMAHPGNIRVTGMLGEQAKDLGDTELAQAIDEGRHGEASVADAMNLEKLIPGYSAQDDFVVAIRPLPATGWLYVTAIPQSQLLAPVQERLYQRALILLAGLLLLLSIVMLVARRFCRPIEKLAQVVNELAAGNLDVPSVASRQTDEVGELSRGFDKMTRELRRHIDRLTSERAAREQVEGELRIARQIQQDLLPSTFPPFPDRKEFDLHAVNLPARHVAGDFFDFFFVPGGLLTFVIADVSGKGVPAAMLMAVTRTIIRNLAMTGLDLQTLVDRTNHMLVEDSNQSMFVTLWIGQYNPQTGDLTYINAGHPSPILRHSDGRAEYCAASTGPLVGVDTSGKMGPFEERTLRLRPGEMIILYTDGVTEAQAPDGELLGYDRPLATAKSTDVQGARTACDQLIAAVQSFQTGEQSDDITVLVLGRVA